MPVNRDYSHRNGESATYTRTLTDQLGLKLVGGYIEGRSQQFINFAELDGEPVRGAGLLPRSTVLGRGAAHLQERSGHGGGRRVLHGQHRLRRLQRLHRHAERHLPPDRPPYGIYITELVEGCVLTKSSAVYGDTAWKLTDKLNLDAGCAGTRTRRPPRSTRTTTRASRRRNCCRTSSSSIPRRCRRLLPGSGVTNYTGHRAFVNVTPRLGLDYHFTDT
jgi:hypothetical protein